MSYDAGFASPPSLAKTQKILELSDSAAVDTDCAQNALPSSRGGARLITGRPGTEVG